MLFYGDERVEKLSFNNIEDMDSSLFAALMKKWDPYDSCWISFVYAIQYVHLIILADQ
jgi:hypothetical protein